MNSGYIGCAEEVQNSATQSVLLLCKDLARAYMAGLESGAEREVTVKVWPDGVDNAPWRLKCGHIPPKSAKSRGLEEVNASTFEHGEPIKAGDIERMTSRGH